MTVFKAFSPVASGYQMVASHHLVCTEFSIILVWKIFLEIWHLIWSSSSHYDPVGAFNVQLKHMTELSWFEIIRVCVQIPLVIMNPGRKKKRIFFGMAKKLPKYTHLLGVKMEPQFTQIYFRSKSRILPWVLNSFSGLFHP